MRALASRAIRIRQAAAGRAHTLFLSESGAVYTCGSNEYGQQGRGAGNVDGVVAPSRVPTNPESRPSDCSGGASHWDDAAVRDAADVLQGPRERSDSTDNARGSARAGSTPAVGSRRYPQGVVDGGGDVSDASCASGSTLAPRMVATGDSALRGLRVTSIAAGDDHCTVVSASRANTLGYGKHDGGGVGGASGVKGLLADTGAQRTRRVFTWGLNTAGQCVQGRVAKIVWSPQEAELLSGARAVGCGAGHTMVVL